MTNDVQDQSILKLERQDRDLEAQLNHARQEQDRIRRRLQMRLLTMTLENAEKQRDFEMRLENALAEFNAVQAERDQIQRDLETRLANMEDRLAEENRRLSRLENELTGVYASLSWRLTAPLRWLNAPFTRWKRC